MVIPFQNSSLAVGVITGLRLNIMMVIYLLLRWEGIEIQPLGQFIYSKGRICNINSGSSDTPQTTLDRWALTLGCEHNIHETQQKPTCLHYQSQRAWEVDKGV